MVINSVEFLLKKTFEKLKLEEKLAIKQLGPDRPDINIIQQIETVFCFPCLLFRASVCTGLAQEDLCE